jgi:solute carrier family 25 phosphate transporter 23/24/25/41
MTQSKPATEVEKGLHEPQIQHHDRVESLWAQLEPSASGELDLKGLKKGFTKIDHRKKLLPLSFAQRRILPHK